MHSYIVVFILLAQLAFKVGDGESKMSLLDVYSVSGVVFRVQTSD